MPSLDASMLDDLRTSAGAGLGDIVVAEITGMFLSDAPARIADLREALSAGNAARTMAEGHKLKGFCGTFGALRMMRLAERAEGFAASGQLEAIQALVPELEAEFTVVTGLVQDYLRRNAENT